MAQPGAALWTNRYRESGVFERSIAVGADNGGNIFVAGHSGYYGVNQHYTTIKYSPSGLPLWTNHYYGREYPWYDFPTALAVDSDGNVIVTGYSAKSGGQYDYATIKYSGAGLPLWTNRYDGPGRHDDRATAITIDASSNIIVTGYSPRRSFSPYNNDFATIKYSSAGTPLWTNRYDGPGNGDDEAKSVAVDANGNVFVTGYSSGDGGNFALIKYASAGLPLWTNRSGAWGARDVAVDTNGHAFLTGGVWNGTNSDYATIAYSSAGATLWTNYYNGPGNGTDGGMAMAVSGTGNVIVTGYSDSSGDNGDFATIAYANTGVPLWTNHYDGSRDDLPYAMALDVSGNVFVAGLSYNAGGAVDMASVAYSSVGVPLWTNLYSSGVANDIAVDSAGNVCVTGESEGEFGREFITIKYSRISSIAPIPLTIQKAGNQLVLSWTNPVFNLQSAPAAHGDYTNILGATSPYTNFFSGDQQYFQLKAD